MWQFDGQQLLEGGPSLVILRPPFEHLYFTKRFCNWARDSDFELHMRLHASRYSLAGITLDFLPSRHRITRVITSILWVRGESWRGLLLLCVPTPMVFRITPGTFQTVIFVIMWFRRLQPRSLWYGNSSCFFCWPELAPMNQFRSKVAYWSSGMEYCCCLL